MSEIKKGLELAPSLGLLRSMLGFCSALKGDTATAIQSAEEAVQLDSGLSVREGQLAYVYSKTGQQSKAAEIATRLAQRAESQRAQWFPVAMAKLALGDKGSTLTALEHAVDGHEIGLIEFSLLNDRMWDPLRDDPRFKRILARMNLVPYEKRGGAA